MNPRDFVRLFARERDALITEYTSSSSETRVAKLLFELNSRTECSTIRRELISAILTDTYYSVLLALDGCASLGGVQQQYRLSSEDGSPLTGNLEGLAYEALQSSGGPNA